MNTSRNVINCVGFSITMIAYQVDCIVIILIIKCLTALEWFFRVLFFVLLELICWFRCFLPTSTRNRYGSERWLRAQRSLGQYEMKPSLSNLEILFRQIMSWYGWKCCSAQTLERLMIFSFIDLRYQIQRSETRQ